MSSVVKGDTGYIELQRTSLEYVVRATLNPDDVNTGKKRFSVLDIDSSVITGDRLDISTVDDSDMELVSGHNYPDGSWYVNVDAAGGLRLFDSFDKALEGLAANALALVTPSNPQDLFFKARDNSYRPLAKVTNYEFTTVRELVQTETLGDTFKKQYENGLIQGQGSVTCFWEHRYLLDDPDTRHAVKPEFASYLARLILRLNQGSEFLGKFYLFRESLSSPNNAWYECEAQVTNCAITVPAAGVLEARIDFITNGKFKLKVGTIDAHLLKEDADFVLKEDGSKIFLEDQ